MILEAKDINHIFCIVIAVQAHMGEEQFIECFGAHVGQYWYKKFRESNCQLISIWQKLDADNKNCLLEYLAKFL